MFIYDANAEESFSFFVSIISPMFFPMVMSILVVYAMAKSLYFRSVDMA